MRLKAYLACSKLAWFPLSSATGRAADGEYLFGVGFFFHGAKDNVPSRSTEDVQF